MSLWADYVKERLGRETIERDYGFISFSFEGETCLIWDYYVVPTERRSRRAWSLADEVCVIAKERGALRLIGFVWPDTVGASISIQAMLAYGFELVSAEGGRILMSKELGG